MNNLYKNIILITSLIIIYKTYIFTLSHNVKRNHNNKNNK